MHIIVCIKQVLDPEMPPAKFKIDAGARKAVQPEGIPLVVSPFDAQAVEAALRIKDANKDVKVTALTVGGDSAKDAIKHVLSMGVDEGVIISDESFGGSDSFGTAHILAKAIEKLGSYDLVLCGRQAADWDMGAVGPILAEYLKIPVLTLAKQVEVVDGRLRVRSVLPDGYAVLECSLPALVTISNEIGQARLPSGRGIVMAARKQVPVWTAQDIGCDPGRVGRGAARSEVVELFVPVNTRKQIIIQGETQAEAARDLAAKLRADNIL